MSQLGINITKRKTTKRFIQLGLPLLSALGLSILSYTNCSDVRLLIPESPEVVIASQAGMCLAPPEAVVRKNKIMFIVDKSGSNTNTDPGDVRRGNNIERFFTDHQNEAFTEWSLIVFGVETNKAHAYVNEGDVFAPKFGTAAEMGAAITRMRATADNGCTPYIAALELAKRGIQRDMILDQESSSVYNLFFLSDGLPNDANAATGCGNTNPVTNSPTDPYLLKTRDLVSLAPDKIFLHTAYYSPPAQFQDIIGAGLRYMAEAGGGKYINLEGNDVLNFNAITVGPRPEAWMLKRFVVRNLNVGYCRDGSVEADSDSDGLCDKDEIQFNTDFAAKLGTQRFSPFNRNSINPDYSDFFVYKFQILPTGEGLGACGGKFDDEDFDMLNSCEELALVDSQANGPTPQWTDRMKRDGGGASDRRNPDTDGDGFLDFLEFFQFGVKSAPVNYNNIFDRYIGGVTAETLMIEQRHPNRPEYFNPNSSLDLQVRNLGYNNEGQNCYDIKLERLPTVEVGSVPSAASVSGLSNLTHNENENLVMIYYIATQEKDPNGLGYLHYSFQKAKRGQPFQLDLSIGAFKQYKVPAFPSSGL